MFNELFSDKFNNRILLNHNGKNYTVLEFKKLLVSNIKFLKEKNENIVIMPSDNFSFMVKFFASIFAKKNIFLVSDKTKIKDLNFNFDIFENPNLIEDCNFNYNFDEIDSQKTVINFYTSGTSDKSKIIKKSLSNLLEEAKDIGQEFNLKNKNLKILSTTTMSHLFGMTFHLMFPFVNGLIIDTKKISYPENFDDDNAILISTPAFLSAVPKYDIEFKTPPKYIFSAGSKLNNNVFKYLEEKSKIIEIYGSTESGVIAYRTHFEDDLTLFKNVKVKSNESNIEIQSDYIFKSRATINDKIELKNRTLKFKTRTDRLYKIQEKRVSADEIENNLKNNPLTKDCYIIKNSDKLACICALNEDGKNYLIKNNIVNLTKELKNYLANFSEIIPQRWKFIDEIPLNQTGKVDKKLIEHLFNVKLSLPVILDREISKDSITYKIFFYNQCNFFDGHFPDFKLVPGVAQIYLAKAFASVHFKVDCGMGQWKRIKFSNIIKPDSIVCLKLENKDNKVVYEYFSDEKKFSSGVFLCENIFAKALIGDN